MGEIQRKNIKQLFEEKPGCEVVVKGWVRTKRGNKEQNSNS
jgi:aspartyl/asparaginyl-tRNA synthetase